MLPEMALADSYAIAFEFIDRPYPFENDTRTFHQHPKYSELQPGLYTDDTHRALSNTRVLLGGDVFDPLAYIAQYQSDYIHDPRAGFSKRYEAFLKENCTALPEEFATRIVRKPSNGSIMGVAPLGYLRTPEEVMFAAACQAMSTHSHTTIPYAQIVALSAHFFIYDHGTKDDLVGFLHEYLDPSSSKIADFLDEERKDEPVHMGASSATKLMLDLVPKNNSLNDLVRQAVEIGGDTDSASAIMVAVASCSKEYEFDFHDDLVSGCEAYLGGSMHELFQYDRKLRKHFLNEQCVNQVHSIVECKERMRRGEISQDVFRYATENIPVSPEYRERIFTAGDHHTRRRVWLEVIDALQHK